MESGIGALNGVLLESGVRVSVNSSQRTKFKGLVLGLVVKVLVTMTTFHIRVPKFEFQL